MLALVCKTRGLLDKEGQGQADLTWSSVLLSFRFHLSASNPWSMAATWGSSDPTSLTIV